MGSWSARVGSLFLAIGAIASSACSDSDSPPGGDPGAGGQTVGSSTGGDAGGGQGGAEAGAGNTGGSDVGTGGSGVSTGEGGSGGSAGQDGTAPPGAVPGEQPAEDGDNAVVADEGEDAVLRVEVGAGEHLGFFLRFEPGIEGVVLELSRWDGEAAEVLAFTDGGSGLRTLAAVDASGPRTFWLRVSATEPFEGTLAVVRTPYEDGPQCTSDCDRLLQLPVCNDPWVDGFDWTPSTVFRYQFGRRDLVMLLRHAARQMILGGRSPIIPEDLSQWDAETPGVDVGAPRHASHQDGKDVDLSLYGSDGLSEWRSYCDAVNAGDGRECQPGSVENFDGRANGELYAAFLQSERVTMSFLDAELIDHVEDGAAEAASEDALDPELLPLFSDGVHLQHWPNHDNHIHVRLSETAYDASASSLTDAAFAAP